MSCGATGISMSSIHTWLSIKPNKIPFSTTKSGKIKCDETY